MASPLVYVYEHLLALAVWSAVLLIFILLAILIVGVSMYGVAWWVVHSLSCSKSDHKWLSKSSFEETRKNYFQEECFPKETSVVWHSIEVKMPTAPIRVDVSVINCPCMAASPDSKPSLVVLHGVGSSATLLISSSLAALRENYNVYVIDIPGFGTSDTTSRIDHLSTDACLDFYAQCFDQLMTLLDLQKPIIVAHSVGAFLAVHTMHQWSKERIGGMVLVSPAGILPTLSAAGAYWAMLFYAGIPMSLFRFFGNTFGSLLFLPILSKPTCPRTSYWLQVQASTTGVNIPAKFINLGFAYSYWNRPQLNNILQSTLDIAMIWGDKDDLMPIETGRLLVRLGEKLGKRFVLEPVVGAGHSPFHVNGGADFAVALHKVVQNLAAHCTAESAHTKSHDKKRGVTVALGDSMIEMQHGHWRSSFSTYLTRNRVADLHRYIEHSVDAYVCQQQKIVM